MKRLLLILLCALPVHATTVVIAVMSVGPSVAGSGIEVCSRGATFNGTIPVIANSCVVLLASDTFASARTKIGNGMITAMSAMGVTTTGPELVGFVPNHTHPTSDLSSTRTARGTTGACATTGCSVTATWTVSGVATPFADTLYTVTCSIQDATAGSETTGLHVGRITAVAAGSVTVWLDNLSNSTVTGTVHCIGFHD